ncbi:hypothetical protein EYF80_036810 [Liparis tanakae]|uniref:Uncharacterized protein n=1 Tax=Liparis tanakae TaxID=230148 RepID=A0A4Z2GI14_9TELE|nr:hypothetical protein EYF80_036810 [Liparis tanakae]
MPKRRIQTSKKKTPAPHTMPSAGSLLDPPVHAPCYCSESKGPCPETLAHVEEWLPPVEEWLPPVEEWLPPVEYTPESPLPLLS